MSVLHGDRDFDDDEDDRRRDKEISLGTSMVLGIFFALTLLLAGFFAFGYSMGRKSAQTAAAASDDGAPATGGNETFKTFKPSPGTAAIQAGPGYSAKDAAAANASASGTVFAPVGTPLKLSAPAAAKPAAAGTAPVAVAAVKTKSSDAIIVGDPVPVAPAAPVKPGIIPVALGSAAAKPAAPAGGSGTMVQVSAFTRQEDADVVVSALKRKGYNVFIRREPQDNYLHVQLGPYGSKKEAEAMREKLSSDGFNAMVK